MYGRGGAAGPGRLTAGCERPGVRRRRSSFPAGGRGGRPSGTPAGSTDQLPPRQTRLAPSGPARPGRNHRSGSAGNAGSRARRSGRTSPRSTRRRCRRCRGGPTDWPPGGRPGARAVRRVPAVPADRIEHRIERRAGEGASPRRETSPSRSPRGRRTPTRPRSGGGSRWRASADHTTWALHDVIPVARHVAQVVDGRVPVALRQAVAEIERVEPGDPLHRPVGRRERRFVPAHDREPLRLRHLALGHAERTCERTGWPPLVDGSRAPPPSAGLPMRNVAPPSTGIAIIVRGGDEAAPAADDRAARGARRELAVEGALAGRVEAHRDGLASRPRAARRVRRRW